MEKPAVPCTIPPQNDKGGSEEEMQAKQLGEIRTMVEVGAKIEGITLTRTKKDGGKEGWVLSFNYQHHAEGMQPCQLITQRNDLRIWLNLNTALNEVEELFPGIREVVLVLE